MVLRKKDEGIFIIDRAPTDPLVFTYPETEIPQKAELLLKIIGHDKAKFKAVPGHIILLTGDENHIASRISYRGRQAKVDDIKTQQRRLEKLYEGRGVTVIDTLGLSVEKVVKLIAQVIHNDKYTKKQLHSLLQKVKRGQINVE